MEMLASRRPGMLDRFAEVENAERIDVGDYKNSQQASPAIKELF
jgi:hypothetical protein